MHRIPSWLLAAVACTTVVGAAGGTLSPPAQNLTQKVDHASNDNATFLQRYQLDTTHFKPGGPILFHQGEELSLENSPIAEHVFSDYAPKLGGIAATLEHRYFGRSYPYGLNATSDISTNLKEYAPLTVGNILQDAVEFVNFIRRTVPGAQDSKAMYASSSYGAFLAVLARVHHPETFYGSFAMSPPIRSLGAGKTLEDNPYLYAATDMVANIYWDADADAARKIRDALKELNACAKDSTCSTAIPDLNVCSQPASAVEWGIFQLYFMSQYAVIAQQNYARATRYSTVYPANSLAVLINETLGASTTAQVLRAVGLLGNSSSTAATCVDWAGVRAREQANVDPVDNSWFYILCRDLPLSLFAVRPGNTLFPPLSPDIDLASTSCGFVGEDWVTPDLYASNARWEEKYNITDAVLDEVRRLVITQGTFDRISAVGTPNLSRPTSDRNQSRVITVTGMAHVESAVSETLIPRGLRPQVDEVRDTQLAYIQEWLGIANIAVSGGSGNNGASSSPSPGSN